MGLFNKIKNLFQSKKEVSSQIEDRLQEDQLVEQKKFDAGLKKSSSNLNSHINEIAKKYRTLNQDLIDEIEEVLITYDIGTASTQKILNAIIEEIKLQNVSDPELIKQIIIDKLIVYYIQDSSTTTSINIKKGEMNVILVTGVNGVGKTTSVAKLANRFLKENLKVCLIAGDTFRAGAVEQLNVWAQRLNIQIFKPKKEGQDPASVVFEGVQWAKENNMDVVLCDTSGRLQSKINLMNELKKIHEIIQKFVPTQPCESLLVLDATTGQNGLQQAKAFNEVTRLTGVILTKMDGTSKGGIILSIKDVFNLPIKYIGLGESIDDLEAFDLEMYVHGIASELDLEK